jgi:hypothetical protein
VRLWWGCATRSAKHDFAAGVEVFAARLFWRGTAVWLLRDPRLCDSDGSNRLTPRFTAAAEHGGRRVFGTTYLRTGPRREAFPYVVVERSLGRVLTPEQVAASIERPEQVVELADQAIDIASRLTDWKKQLRFAELRVGRSVRIRARINDALEWGQGKSWLNLAEGEHAVQVAAASPRSQRRAPGVLDPIREVVPVFQGWFPRFAAALEELRQRPNPVRRLVSALSAPR